MTARSTRGYRRGWGRRNRLGRVGATAVAAAVLCAVALGACAQPLPPRDLGADPAAPASGVTASGSGTATAPSPGGATSSSGAGGTPAALQPAAPPPIGDIPAGAVRVAEFVAECRFSHRLADDPIVLPGLPGASHSHDFFGNDRTDASTTYRVLLTGATNCQPSLDLSSYWAPTLYQGDTAIPPDTATFYYLGEGVSREVTTSMVPMPVGLMIVAGNAKATVESESRARWSCLHAGHVGASKNFVTCPAGTKLETYLDFPQCWNGRDLDSSDHKGHMAYPVGNACPASHPVAVPKLRMVLRYPVNGDSSALRLSSGPGLTMHADFFNAWSSEALAQRVRDCINRIVKCGTDGQP